MDSNEEVVQKRVVVGKGDQRSEVVTESSQRVVSPSGISTTTVALIVFLVVIAAATVIYIVSSRNSQREAELAASSQPPVPTSVQQPAPAPVIIQQAAPAQQAPIVVQQPAQAPPVERELTSANEDAGMQDIATKKLKEDLELGGVITTVTDARAVLTGAVGSEAAKAKAEQLVKGVRGVKSVDNRIVVSG